MLDIEFDLMERFTLWNEICSFVGENKTRFGVILVKLNTFLSPGRSKKALLKQAQM